MKHPPKWHTLLNSMEHPPKWHTLPNDTPSQMTHPPKWNTHSEIKRITKCYLEILKTYPITVDSCYNVFTGLYENMVRTQGGFRPLLSALPTSQQPLSLLANATPPTSQQPLSLLANAPPPTPTNTTTQPTNTTTQPTNATTHLTDATTLEPSLAYFPSQICLSTDTRLPLSPYQLDPTEYLEFSV